MAKKLLVILCALVLLGAFLRTYKLGRQSLWYDESCSVNVASASLPDIISGRAKDMNPPFYFILLHFWIKLFDQGEVPLRLLGAIFGVLTIVFAYILGRRLIGAKGAVYAVFLLAVSPWHIYLAQEARVYTLLAMLWAASFYFLARCFDAEDNLPFWAGYVITTFFCIYSHYYSFFLIFTQALLAVSFARERGVFFKRFLISVLIVAAAYLPWMPVFLSQLGTRGTPLFSWVQGLFGFPVYCVVGRTLVWKGAGLPAVALASILIMLFFWAPVTRGFFALRKAKDRFSFRLVLLWILVPLFIAVAVSVLRTPLITERYLIIIGLPVLLLAGLGLSSISNKYLRALLIVGISALSAASLFNYYTRPYKPDWRSATAYVWRQAKPEDIILFDPDFEKAPFAYYFKGGNTLAALYPEPDPNSDKLMGQIVRGGGWVDLGPQIEGAKRVWLLQSDANLYSGAFYFKWLEKQKKVAGLEKFHRIKAYLFIKE